MRSVFVENLNEYGNEIVLKVKDYHHLVNVVRLKIEEKILIFDKNKNLYEVQVKSITKKEIQLIKLEEKQVESKGLGFKVALGKLKKDALDLSIKQLVEIGCEEIIIYQSSFSQSYPMKKERVEKLIISAMEQSNNFNYPQVVEKSFDEILKTTENIIYFSSVENKDQKIDILPVDSLILIGPEGGLSEHEEKLIRNKSKFVLNLPTPILRAQTAVSFCLGYCLGTLSK